MQSVYFRIERRIQCRLAINSPGSSVSGTDLKGTNWYWFYSGSGFDPIKHNYWNTNILNWNNTNWYFEQLVGPKPPIRRPPIRRPQ
jgi:hypothetical protein